MLKSLWKSDSGKAQIAGLEEFFAVCTPMQQEESAAEWEIWHAKCLCPEYFALVFLQYHFGRSSR